MGAQVFFVGAQFSFVKTQFSFVGVLFVEDLYGSTSFPLWEHTFPL